MASSTHRIRIKANPSVVFKAVSTGEGMKAWYTPKNRRVLRRRPDSNLLL